MGFLISLSLINLVDVPELVFCAPVINGSCGATFSGAPLLLDFFPHELPPFFRKSLSSTCGGREDGFRGLSLFQFKDFPFPLSLGALFPFLWRSPHPPRPEVNLFSSFFFFVVEL